MLHCDVTALQALYSDVGVQQPRILALLYQAAQLLETNKADLSLEQLRHMESVTSDVRDRIDDVSVTSHSGALALRYKFARVVCLHVLGSRELMGR